MKKKLKQEQFKRLSVQRSKIEFPYLYFLPEIIPINTKLFKVSVSNFYFNIYLIILIDSFDPGETIFFLVS